MATTFPSSAQDGETQEPKRRFAILFISGLGESIVDQSVAGIAVRVAHALDRNTPVENKYTVLAGAEHVKVREDDGFSLARATVKCTARNDERAEIDIWHLETAGALTSGYEHSGLVAKFMRGAVVVWRYRRKVRTLFEKNGRLTTARVDRAQLTLVRAGVVLLGVYLLALLAALVGEVVRAAGGFGWLPHGLTVAVLGVTSLGIWKARWVRQLTNSAVQLNSLIEYIGEGESVNVFRAHVADALQLLGERIDIVYDQLDVIAYSFGAVVALDAIFPRADLPGPAFESIGTLVTIGCPHDLISTYWPSYYTLRNRRDEVPRRWVNVFSPRDVFGSNFETNAGAEIGVSVHGDVTPVRPQNISWVTVAGDAEAVRPWEIIRIPGMKAHGTYWDGAHDESAFAPLVRDLYRHTPLFA